MYVCFEIGALFCAPMQWGKKCANFKTDIHLDPVKSFLFLWWLKCSENHNTFHEVGHKTYFLLLCMVFSWKTMPGSFWVVNVFCFEVILELLAQTKYEEEEHVLAVVHSGGGLDAVRKAMEAVFRGSCRRYARSIPTNNLETRLYNTDNPNYVHMDSVRIGNTVIPRYSDSFRQQTKSHYIEECHYFELYLKWTKDHI